MRALLADVVGDRDHALVVEEIGGGPGEELSVGAVVDACLTPPFLVDRRVVVVREAGRLLTADVPRLVEVVQDPLPSTVLVLVGRRRDGPGAAGQGRQGGRADHRRDHEQGGGAQGVAARPPAGGAGQARAARRPTCWPATSARTSAASRACSAR